MAQVSTLNRYFALDTPCESFLLLLQLTVAAALPDIDADDLEEVLQDHEPSVAYLGRYLDMSDYVRSLKSDGSQTWRRNLLDLMEVGEEEDDDCKLYWHAGLWLMEFATTSIFVESDRLEQSEAVARTDALLDLLGSGLWLGDIRSTYVEAAAVVVGEARPDWRPGALIGARRAADALLFVDPFTGLAASTALSWINVESAASAGATPAPILARVVAVVGTAPEADAADLASGAAKTLLREMTKVSKRIEAAGTSSFGAAQAEQRLAELHGLQRAQVNTLAFLNSQADQPVASARDALPTLMGQRLTDARVVLSALPGDELQVELLDASGQTRGIWSDSNWYVVSQKFTDTGALQLGLLKYSD